MKCDTKIAKNPQSRHVKENYCLPFFAKQNTRIVSKKNVLDFGDDQEHSYNVADFTDYFVYTRKIFLNFIKNIDKEKNLS